MPLIARTIHTARLVVRPVTEADLPALLAVNSDEAVTALLPYATWKSLEDGRAWLARMAGSRTAAPPRRLVIVDRTAAAAIGACLLFRFDEGSARAELGYVLGRAHWGRGLMREALSGLLDHAFTAIGLRRIEAEVDVRNAPSSHLLARLGFTREGILRQRWFTKGEARDVEMHGLLQNEWTTRGA